VQGGVAVILAVVSRRLLRNLLNHR
jgi:hypothetical protein